MTAADDREANGRIPDRTAFGEPLLDAAGLAKALGKTRRWVYEQVDTPGHA